MSETWGAGGSSFQSEALSAHNAIRQRHGVPALELSNDLTRRAQEWAEHLASIGRMMHSKGNDFGENVSMMFGKKVTGESVTDQWYAGAKNYDFRRAEFSPDTGYFTQMVWKGTKQFGIGKAEEAGGKVYTVAFYRPAGNRKGAFQDNVFPVGQHQ